MNKKADTLLFYGVWSLGIGAMLLIFFVNVGTLFGEDETRHLDYALKDLSLTINALNSMPGNTFVDLNRNIYTRNLLLNSTAIEVHDSDDIASGLLRYRSAGIPGMEEKYLERPEHLEILKSSDGVSINTDPELDLLNCHTPGDHEHISSVRVIYDDSDGVEQFTSRVSENIHNSLELHFDRMSPRQPLSSYTGIGLDLEIILSSYSSRSSNDFRAYVHHANPRSREMACRILNQIALHPAIDVDSLSVFSIDPLFDDVYGSHMYENTVFFKLGSTMNDMGSHMVRLRNIFSDVMGDYG